MERYRVWCLAAVVVVLVVVAGGASAVGYSAYVRVVQLSPNALSVDVKLLSTLESATLVVPADWQDMHYLAVSPWIEVVPDEYQLLVTVDDIVLTKRLTLNPDMFYTVDLSGLTIPDELSELAATGLDRSFWQTLLEFVVGQDPTHVMLFQPRVFMDDFTFVHDGEIRVRLVHAAPGLEPVDLAVKGERGSVIHDVLYGQASPYAELRLGEPLEVRLAGSRVAIDSEELVQTVMQPGFVHTIFIAGSPAHVSAHNLSILVLADPCQPRVDIEDSYSGREEAVADQTH